MTGSRSALAVVTSSELRNGAHAESAAGSHHRVVGALPPAGPPRSPNARCGTWLTYAPRGDCAGFHVFDRTSRC